MHEDYKYKFIPFPKITFAGEQNHFNNLKEMRFRKILDTSVTSGVKYISSAILRLRSDIWERMQSILCLLDMEQFKKHYEQIYRIKEPIKGKDSLKAEDKYTQGILKTLKTECERKNLKYGFPNLRLENNYSIKDNHKLISILDFIK